MADKRPASVPGPRRKFSSAGPLVILLAITAICFRQVPEFEFITYDDPVYVTGNPLVRGGLTLAGFLRAWGEAGSANLWHPLTWWSHMADTSLFGTGNAMGPHLMNGLWHLLAAAGLFQLLRRLTGRPWLTLALTLLWAVHPLRVQSVAWVSERKDVLCGAFFFWSWWAWEAGRGDSRHRLYALCVLLFGAALLAKPSALPLPFVLLAGEWLRRCPSSQRRHLPDAPGTFRSAVLRLLPMILMAAACAVVTVYFQRRGQMWEVVEVMPAARRLLLMPGGLWWYLQHFFVPYPDLLWVYPPEGAVAWLHAVSGAVGLLLILGLAWRFRQRSWLIGAGLAGMVLLWLPVSGIVPVSFYYVADRYSYFLHAGLVLSLAGIFTPGGSSLPRPVFGGILWSVWVLALAGITHVRLGRWRSSESLFTAETAGNPRSLLAPLHLGQSRLAAGRPAQALPQFRHAMELDKASGMAAFLAGQAAEMTGHPADAAGYYQTAISRRLPDGKAWSRLAALRAAGAPADAASVPALLDDALGRFPNDPVLHAQLGAALHDRQRSGESADSYRRALGLEPDCIPALQGLAGVLLESGPGDEATRQTVLELLDRLLALQPESKEIRALRNQLSPPVR